MRDRSQPCSRRSSSSGGIKVEAAPKATAYKYTDGSSHVDATSYDKSFGLVDIVAAAAVVHTCEGPP